MTTTAITIRQMTPQDWPGVADIYQQGIETGNATFQQELPLWDQWSASHLQACRLVAAEGATIVGWAALTAVSGRCVYAGVAEVSVYVARDRRGQKIGTQLLHRLILDSEAEGFWTLQAGIFPENTASLRLHEGLGFRQVGYREKIGSLRGVWRDTLLLERRSAVVGTT